MSKKKESVEVGRQPFTPDCPRCNGATGKNPGQKLRAASSNSLFTYYQCSACGHRVKLPRPRRPTDEGEETFTTL